MGLFRAAYPRYPDISQIHVSMEERDYYMDLRPIMNRTPSTVLHATPLPQVCSIFFSLNQISLSKN